MTGGRQRLDLAVVASGLASSRAQAQALIMAGDILINGQAVMQASRHVPPDATLTLKAKPRFVSRGGEKLDHALALFAIDVTGMVCADFGASTGGFTDCLLQRGAARVYAIDVGYGQLDASLRPDPRIVVMERVNVRTLEHLPEPIDVVVIDVSFISLRLVLPSAKAVLTDEGVCVALIKPQFEAGKGQVGKGGVVRDPAVHREVLDRALDDARNAGFTPSALTRSPLTGPAGNVEFLARFDRSPEAAFSSSAELIETSGVLLG